MRGLAQLAVRFNLALCRIENLVMIVFLSVAAVLGITQVVMRYVFLTGREWLEPLLVILVVNTALIGAAVAVRRAAHIRLEILPDLLPPRLRRMLEVVTNLLGLLYAVIVGVAGAAFVNQVIRFQMINIESGFPAWVHCIGVPIGMAFLGLRFLQEAVFAALGWPTAAEREAGR